MVFFKEKKLGKTVSIVVNCDISFCMNVESFEKLDLRLARLMAVQKRMFPTFKQPLTS